MNIAHSVQYVCSRELCVGGSQVKAPVKETARTSPKWQRVHFAAHGFVWRPPATYLHQASPQGKDKVLQTNERTYVAIVIPVIAICWTNCPELAVTNNIKMASRGGGLRMKCDRSHTYSPPTHATVTSRSCTSQPP